MSATSSEANVNTAAAPPPTRGAATLVVVLLAVFLVPMSISGTAVALPAISASVGGGAAGQQWVVNAFNLSFACFTLVWGSLADRFGRGRLFLFGAVIFALGSIASAVAPTIAVLDGARALAGLGGAAIFSCGSAIISSQFDGAARLRAFALFGTTAGIGVALGPTISGVLVDTTGWRAIFLVQTAVLVVVVLFAPVIGWSRPQNVTNHRFDTAGTVLFVLALLALMVGIVEGQPWGWASPAVIGAFSASVILLAAFIVVESRTSAPLLDLALLRHPRFLALCLVPVAASFGFVTLLTYFPTFLQFVVGQSSLHAGSTVILLTVPVVLGPIAAARAVGAGVRPLTVIWVSIAALLLGDLGLLLAGPDTAVAVIAVPLLLVGSGMGLSAGLVDGQALSLVSEDKAGMAAGVVNTLRLGSEAIAVALYASILTGVVTGRADSATGSIDGVTDSAAIGAAAASGDPDAALRNVPVAAHEQVTSSVIDAYNSGFHATLLAMTSIVAFLALVIAALLRRGTER
ncbi:MFS transporter [Rhodococcus sp. H29-C3]|uniref:MFS transporter n=1 Tax=Rhodococcus sp. H29-C3 TaxID=3046307 RepID=UPI0024BB3B85|nr:MFS transporter [Rhodococcus sp. H29-C3]MDJ0363202.1 MFS transporter [Rhodococcus sp. H29-C3]